MRALNLIFLDADPARLHGGLSLAVSAAALGRPVALFFQGAAVRALRRGAAMDGGAEAAARTAAGIPTSAQLMAQADELGILITACESGLHITGLGAADLRPGTETGGLVGFLAAARDGELLTI